MFCWGILIGGRPCYSKVDQQRTCCDSRTSRRRTSSTRDRKFRKLIVMLVVRKRSGSRMYEYMHSRIQLGGVSAYIPPRHRSPARTPGSLAWGGRSTPWRKVSLPGRERHFGNRLVFSIGSISTRTTRQTRQHAARVSQQQDFIRPGCREHPGKPSGRIGPRCCPQVRFPQPNTLCIPLPHDCAGFADSSTWRTVRLPSSPAWPFPSFSWGLFELASRLSPRQPPLSAATGLQQFLACLSPHHGQLNDDWQQRMRDASWGLFWCCLIWADGRRLTRIVLLARPSLKFATKQQARSSVVLAASESSAETSTADSEYYAPGSGKVPPPGADNSTYDVSSSETVFGPIAVLNPADLHSWLDVILSVIHSMLCSMLP